MNRTALIKLASQHGYDLSPKFTDEKGNPTKVLVPLDMGRTEPLAPHEVMAKPLPKYTKGKTDDVLRDSYPYSGYDWYARNGAITPVDSSKIDNSKFKQRPTSTTDLGLMNINKVIASQLGGGPIAEATANALVEYARQQRYNALSRHDKKRYDTVAAVTGKKPHAITMTVPTNFNYILTNWLTPPQGADYSQWSRDKVLKDAEGNPLLYNSTNGKPKFIEGSVMLNPSYFRKAFTRPTKKDGARKYVEMYNPVNNIFSEGYLNGSVPIVRENFPKWVTAEDDTRGAVHLNSLMSVNEDGESALGRNSLKGNRIYSIPGISLENKGWKHTPDSLLFNDYAIPAKGDENSYVHPGDDKSVADHEAIHAMNSVFPSDFSLGFKFFDDAMVHDAYVDPNNAQDVADSKDSLRAAADNLRSVDLSKSEASTLNGFLSNPNTYFETGGEGARFLVTALRGYQNHLKNVLPAQMEARGELDGLNEKERNDKIGWRIAELSHDGVNFINYLKALGLFDGVLGNWRFPVSSLGGISAREMNRALEGIDKVTEPKEKLFERIRPEDREGKDLNSYDSVSEESIKQVLPYLLQNDYSDVNPDGSVLS